MTHHRCSRCREEVGIRHKRSGYLFCDECLRPAGPRFGVIRNFFTGVWGWLRETFQGIFDRPTHAAQRRTYNAKTRARMASAQWKALAVPANPAAVSPQMR